MDVARLNFSHGNLELHAENAQRVRTAATKVGRPVAILQDLPGPKLRIGALHLTEELENARQAIGMDLHDQTLADLFSRRLPGPLADELQRVVGELSRLEAEYRIAW